MVGAPLWRMLEGQTIQEQYHLEAFLGAGGYGGVFRATEVIRDRVIRQVAVKLICIDDIDRQRQELITALSVDHPNLLRHFAAGEARVNQQQLPSEAQWEYACRAKTQTLFSFGDNFSDLGDYGWYRGNSNGKTHPVGQKKTNAFGLYDMHGNVWEWCEDVWHENYQGAPTDGSAWVTGGDTSIRAVRGGSWYSNADKCASGYRSIRYAVNRNGNQGFRVVLFV